MKPAEAARRLEALEGSLAAAVQPLPIDVLLNRAKEVAAAVRALAGRNGHQIAIRVVERHNGVRVTAPGPHAARFQSVLRRELTAQLPETAAEVRSQITRKI